MPALHALAAFNALTDMHPELPHEGPARNLGLKLFGDFILDDSTLALRAGVRQVGFVAFANRFGWRRPMAVRAMGVPGLAARRLGIGLRRSLAEGRGLTFASSKRLFEPPRQVGDPSFQFGDALEQRATTGTRGFFHAVIVETGMPLSCASFLAAVDFVGVGR